MSIEVPKWSAISTSPRIETLPQAMQDLGFALEANGCVLYPDGTLHKADDIQKTLQKMQVI